MGKDHPIESILMPKAAYAMTLQIRALVKDSIQHKNALATSHSLCSRDVENILSKLCDWNSSKKLKHVSYSAAFAIVQKIRLKIYSAQA